MELYLNEKKTDEQIKLGEYFTFDQIINEDCDLYNKESEELIFSFKKGIIPKELYDIDPKIVKHSKEGSVNRGNAAGSATTEGLLRGKENWKAKPKYLCDKDGNKIETSDVINYKQGKGSPAVANNQLFAEEPNMRGKSPEERIKRYEELFINNNFASK